MPLVTYLCDKPNKRWRSPGKTDITFEPVVVEPTPTPTGLGPHADIPWTPMTLAELQNPNNFGIAGAGRTLGQLTEAPRTAINTSSQTVWEDTYFTGDSGSSAINVTGRTFRRCKWQYGMGVGRTGANITFEFCESPRLFLNNPANGVVIRRHKAFGELGTDVMHWSSDVAGAPIQDIYIDGLYSVGDKAAWVAGANHQDIIQARGTRDVTIRNFCLDQGTVRDDLFTAPIFFENANGGNDNIDIDNGFARGAGYRHLMLFGTNMRVKRVWLPAGTNINLLHDRGTGQSFVESWGHQYTDGTPIASLHNAP